MNINTSDTLFVSIGENCLTDDILQRHGKKSFSTPYSFTRTNIDYALELERTEYQTLLLPENLYYSQDEHIVRSSVIKDSDNIYNDMHVKGFEFTHHDVIANQEHIESYKRKINRMREIKSSSYKVDFLYHHRYNPNMDVQKIIEKAKSFLEYYNQKSFMTVFYQNIQNGRRDVIFNQVADNIIVFEFITPDVWQGKDPELFFARKDDYLIKIMLNKSQDFAKRR